MLLPSPPIPGNAGERRGVVTGGVSHQKCLWQGQLSYFAGNAIPHLLFPITFSLTQFSVTPLRFLTV